MTSSAPGNHKQIPNNQNAGASQDRIGALYDTISPVYDIWGKLTESHARHRALTLAEISDGQILVEVAVGTAWHSMT